MNTIAILLATPFALLFGAMFLTLIYIGTKSMWKIWRNDYSGD